MGKRKDNENVITDGLVENNREMIPKVFANMLDDWNYDSSKNYVKYTKADGTEAEVSKRVYNLKNKIGNRTTLTVTDIDIIEHIQRIECALKIDARAKYIICKELSYLNNVDTLKKLGFNTIGEYGKAVHGFESSTTNHYARIGKYFIDDNYELHPALPTLSVSHLIELESYATNDDGDIDIEKIIKLYQDNTLTDSMSTKKVREVLKGLKQGIGVNDNDSATNDDNESANESNNVVTAENGAEVVTNENTESNENAESNTTAEPTEEYMHNLEVEFDKQKTVGLMHSLLTALNNCFDIMKNNDIEVVGYNEPIDTLTEIVKSLL